MLEKRFKVLRVVAALYRILAWIVLVAGIICSVGFLLLSILSGGALPSAVFRPEYYGLRSFGYGAPIVTGIIGLVVILLASALYFVLFYSVGELIHLGLAIEENTRETAWYLRGEEAPRPSAET